NEEPKGSTAAAAPTYIVVDYRTTERNNFLASYMAHEMNHVFQEAAALQMTASFMEATAAYVDNALFPEADILPVMVGDFQRDPYRPIYYHDDNDTYDYGAALFVDYLVTRYGLSLITAVFRSGLSDYIAVLDGELAKLGSGFAVAVREFAQWRVRTGRYHQL